MTITIKPLSEIKLVERTFAGRDGKPVTCFVGKGLCNLDDPVMVSVSGSAPRVLSGGKDQTVLLKAYTTDGQIPTARVKLV